MLEIHLPLLLYQGAIFLIFVFLMWKFVYKGLVKMVEDRRARIENMIIETERKRGEAEALRSGYESKVHEINVLAEERIRQAEAEGWRKYEEILDQARTESARIIEAGRRKMAHDIDEALVAARGELVDIASELARKALGRTVTPDVDARLIAELNQELAQHEWHR